MVPMTALRLSVVRWVAVQALAEGVALVAAKVSRIVAELAGIVAIVAELVAVVAAPGWLDDCLRLCMT